MIFFLPIIIASGPVMQQLADQEAASIPMMNVTMIEQLLDEYLPHVLATSITSVFNNMITLLWYSGVQILIFLAALQKIELHRTDFYQRDSIRIKPDVPVRHDCG